MSSTTSRIVQAGQFGRSVQGIPAFFVGAAAYGIKRSRTDFNGALYISTRTSGSGAASVRIVDPPDAPEGVGTPIKAGEPFFSDGLVASGATREVEVVIDGRGLTQGTTPAELVFLTNSPASPITRVPVTITVGSVANEDGVAAVLDGATTRPNPARGTARVSVTLASAETVTVGVYNTLGQRVAVLADAAPMAAGETTLDLPTAALAAGVYVVRVQAGASVSSHKVTVIR